MYLEDSTSHRQVTPVKRKIDDIIEEQNVDDPDNDREAKRLHLYVVSESQTNEMGEPDEDCLILHERAEHLCRLCAESFSDPDDDLLPIFNTDARIIESIEKLLPETIFPDDGKPQNICWTCYHKMNQCIDIIDSFNIAQAKFD